MNIGSQQFTEYTHELKTAPMMTMMRLLFLFVLTMSIAAQTTISPLIASCGSIAEFSKAVEKHCMSSRAKRSVLEENGRAYMYRNQQHAAPQYL